MWREIGSVGSEVCEVPGGMVMKIRSRGGGEETLCFIPCSKEDAKSWIDEKEEDLRVRMGGTPKK